MFKLSKRSKGSEKWQVRKRWPAEVAPILKGEFVASTGEADKKRAQQRLPFIAAEYEARVAEARATIAQAVSAAAEPQETAREKEEREARAEVAAFKAAAAELRRNDPTRVSVRKAYRKYCALTTAELPPDIAGVVDIINEGHADAEKLRKTVAFLEGRIAELSGAGASGARGAPAGAPSGRTVDDLITAYEADKSPGWSSSTKKAVVPVFRLLRDVFPGRALASVTRDEARGVVKLLEGLPANLGKRKELRGLTVPEAVEKGRGLGLPTIQPKTLNDGYLLHIASMWNWAVKETWIASTPFSGLAVYDPVDDAERRDPFTPEQLQTIFSGAPWVGPWGPERGRAGDYWVPLLCLFHGLRNGEAAGLRVEDIGEDDGVPVIRIRPYDGRSLKTKDARGTLPIHPEVLRLGFLGYVAGRREAQETLLFPEGVDNGRGQIGAKLGERFSNRVKQLGFTGRKLGMHSFRHNFEDRLRAAELPERTALALARRTEAGSSRVYGDGLSARQKAEAFARVNYPGLSLSHLRAAPEGERL